MHYYQFSIGDYRAATMHLSNEEDLAYRRLLDMYYDTENKIPLDTQWVAKRLRLATDVVDEVLKDMFVKHEDGWYHARCDDVIQQYHAMAEKNRANGRLGGRKKNPLGFESQPIAKATNNYKPETINQEPKVKTQRGSRLPTDWSLPEEWKAWAEQERPDLNTKTVADSFRDFWISKAGAGGVKLDWQATWRNWIRSQSTPKTFANKFDVAHITTPPPPNQDAALRKIEEDRKKAVPPSLETLAKLAELRKQVV
jgi:uncharacterized protein YdaU (DUF1376 family)